ncbi:hypothetical protein CcrKarma_gp317 [Caulobacter virus Karma]|uniref:hypothetical protein n=1 Tax=Caulobacter virus Magneto TaxID=1211642 RepID=UPI00028B1DD9|nr:hypothetical protein CcrMagneto_gp311 [Caulobacter virus Magneto]YP_006989697.1 hypothetical protein CcrKarma_gp317 [Caulobacter virus Karma]AFU87481.1 hypothetical protein CcrMagneto_gp311 [Caulobacter virus Magneto]AFU87834.1 hypothetical protein CcrKarma_gp317 [Caulobacter virus Karma]
MRRFMRAPSLSTYPIPYQLERYLLNNRDVRLVRCRDGWRLQGRTGVFHRSRVPGTGRYSWRSVAICLDSLCVIESYDETMRPDVVGLAKDVV